VEEVTRALLPFTACLHVKDYTVIRGDTDMGFTIIGTPAGQGKLNIPDQLIRLKEANPQAGVVLEQWTPFADTIEQTVAVQEQWAEQGIRYLKKVWSELEL
jgi:L-ribulose-5-phosphate 3-epimerase UlaE